MVDRRFHLRPTVLELGYTYLSVLGVPQVATPHLVALTERLDESTSLGVLDGDDVVYVARIGSRRVFVNGATVGMRGAAWLSSHGRVLLAALPAADLDAHLGRVQLERRTAHTVRDTGELRRRLAQVRAQGWSLVEEELEEG
ncbi:IclR family transcriptional regulator, partial [Modestobacter sp. VKM Ac-2676]